MNTEMQSICRKILVVGLGSAYQYGSRNSRSVATKHGQAVNKLYMVRMIMFLATPRKGPRHFAVSFLVRGVVL
jgi:hypothetical protein